MYAQGPAIGRRTRLQWQEVTIDNFVREGNRVSLQYREEYGTRSITTLRVL